jgi:CBS domain-containing protein
MKVKELMSTDTRTCSPDTTVAAAAQLMWDADCGILPVVDEGELMGVVTDRDMYIALATRNERASHLRVGAVAAGPVATCRPEDDVHVALATMRDARVRRLPVVSVENTVLGVLSMNDILRAAGADRTALTDDVVQTLRAICGHDQAGPRAAAA